MAESRATRIKEAIYAALDRAAAAKKPRWFLIKLHESVGTALGAGNYDDDGNRTGENKVLSAIGSLDPRAILIDVGANNGSWTLEARARIPGSSVIAIEPGSQAIGTLTARTEVDDRVFIVPVAIGALNTSMKLFGIDNGLQASLRPEVLARTTRVGQTEIPSEVIRVCDWPTIVEMIKELGIDFTERPPTAFKLDIEGLELDVLQQLVAWSGFTSVRVVQFEFHMHALAQGHLVSDFDLLLGSDFRLFRLTKHALVSRDELSDAEANYFGFSNWVAVRNADVMAFTEAFGKATGARARPYEWRC